MKWLRDNVAVITFLFAAVGAIFAVGVVWARTSTIAENQVRIEKNQSKIESIHEEMNSIKSVTTTMEDIRERVIRIENFIITTKGAK